MKDFTNLYSRSATLRFELRPQRETLQHFLDDHILESDEKRAASYIKVKDIIDEYHKDFIDRALRNNVLQLHSVGKHDSLEEYYNLYMQSDRDENMQKAFDTVMDNMRKNIVAVFKAHEAYKSLFSADLFTKALPVFLENQNEKIALVNEFGKFSTYFQGFFDNRKNMYSKDAISTSVGFRLVHQNLPKFIDNMVSWEKISKALSDELQQGIYSEYESYLNVENVSEIFALDYYNTVLTQKHIDVYNNVVGALNKEINLYNQQQKEKNNKLPKLKVLFKQILSDRESLVSYLPQQIENDQQLIEVISAFYAQFEKSVLQPDGDKVMLRDLLTHLDEYQLDGIYVTASELSTISTVLLGNWNKLGEAQRKCMLDQLAIEIPQKKTQKEAKYREKLEQELDKRMKLLRSFSLQEINKWLRLCDPNLTAQNYFATCGARICETHEEVNLFTQITCAKTELDQDLSTQLDKRSRLNNRAGFVKKLKTLFDAFQKLNHFVKPLFGRGDEVGKDERFYADLELYTDIFVEANILYNAVRNYITKKPYSTEKIKLNFDNSQLLKGWDANKLDAYSGIVLMKDGLYYLGILKKGTASCNRFKDMPNTQDGESTYSMIYRRGLKSAASDLARIPFAESNKALFNPDPEMYRKMKEEKCHMQGDNFDINYLHELIDFFKFCLETHPSWKEFKLSLKPTNSYHAINEFYNDVNEQAIIVSEQLVPERHINKLIEDGDLYFFQIYNKDFSPYSKGKPNLHTIYWKMLFDHRNLNKMVYKLLGNAEIFYRKSSIGQGDIILHPANQAIANKKDYNKDKQGYKPQSTFEYDIVKDRRYTVDKFQFHVPISMNVNAPTSGNLNEAVQEAIRGGSFEHIIGIDRGERHLLYLTMIDMTGKVVKQFTLNEIIDMYQGKTITTNYHTLLDKREKERDQARKSWESIHDIKNLKSGYLSQVVHVISQLIIEYKALVVLEDLNMGFKNSRKKVEKQVYQEFEKMLINKLNYLVDKDTDPEQAGGALKAYQLSNKFVSFNKLGKQSGVLFYVPAWMTSKIDPVTGFCNMLDTRYENTNNAQLFFHKMKSIRYNKDHNYFEFTFDYKEYTKRADGTRTLWTICTVGKRVKTYRDSTKNSQWVSEEYDLTQAFKNLFGKFDVAYEGNLKDEIVRQNSKEFFVELLHLLKATMQLRNSMTNSEVDYLVSPVANAQGQFFDSEKAKSEGRDHNGNWLSIYPVDADANGAFNIARKGLMYVDIIKKAIDGKKPKLAITNKDWLKFVQDMDK